MRRGAVVAGVVWDDPLDDPLAPVLVCVEGAAVAGLDWPGPPDQSPEWSSWYQPPSWECSWSEPGTAGPEALGDGLVDVPGSPPATPSALASAISCFSRSASAASLAFSDVS
ncbi:MAG: hypothetical protein IPK24_00290 [Kineosporiaceae bacterium]|nr:hypothetical protein [Kineosporiaceae bacterium]